MACRKCGEDFDKCECGSKWEAQVRCDVCGCDIWEMSDGCDCDDKVDNDS